MLGIEHINVSAQAQTALKQFLAGEKYIISDVVSALETTPPPSWVLPIVGFAPQLLPFLKAAQYLNTLLPS